ncbi:MAG: transposase [Planctomycetaceae bacterium]|nr:transposase [Planctomycetaceae bacterium]
MKGVGTRPWTAGSPCPRTGPTTLPDACYVPEDVASRKTWEIAHDQRRRRGPGVPHGWVVGDEAFGRARACCAPPRTDGERSVLDVPCHTTVRDPGGGRPPREKGRQGPKRKVLFVGVDPWARKLPADRWTRLTVRARAKRPLEVEAVAARGSPSGGGGSVRRSGCW